MTTPHSERQATHDPTASAQSGEPIGESDTQSFTGPEKTPSLAQVWSLFRTASQSKQAEWMAQLNLVESEATVLKQSVIVTVLSTLAAFFFACCVWVALNVALALALISYTALAQPFILLLLVALNVGACVLAILSANSAYRHLSIMPLFKSAIGKVTT